MKKLFIAIIVLSCTSVCCHAQSGSDLELTKKLREYMIMDADNPDFAWAKQLSDTTLLLGLSPDGEMFIWRASEIWKTNTPNGDEAFAHIVVRGEGDVGDTLIFVRGPQPDSTIVESLAVVDSLDSQDVVVAAAVLLDSLDIIGAFSYNGNMILDSELKLVATIDIYGNLISVPQAKIGLTLDKADPAKAAFFYLTTYLIEKR